MSSVMSNGKVYDLLYHLGVTANYTGFFHTAYAVSLCAEQPDRLLLVTKWLYPEVAKQYGTNWKAWSGTSEPWAASFGGRTGPGWSGWPAGPWHRSQEVRKCWQSWLLPWIPAL